MPRGNVVGITNATIIMIVTVFIDVMMSSYLHISVLCLPKFQRSDSSMDNGRGHFVTRCT